MGSNSKDKAIANLRNTTEYLQHTLLGLCLATDKAVRIDSVENIQIHLDSAAIDLTDFAKEFIQDRAHSKRFDSTLFKLVVSSISMAYNVAKKYYKNSDKDFWETNKQWQSPYLYAGQIRNMFSHAFYWEFHKDWIKNYEKMNCFPIQYRNLQIVKSWNGRKATFADVSPLGDLIQIVEDIIADISKDKTL